MIRPGDRIGHIRIAGEIAEGGMGAVFVGFDEKLEREVALKAIRRDRLGAAARVRFLNEARLLSQLDHPNVCRIHGYLESGRGDFLVLELIRGRTLRQALGEGIDPAAKLSIAEGVARALEAAHEKGIIHRDLKPENVMLTEEGQVKVLDFGLARSETADLDDESPGPAEPPWADTLPAGSSWWVPSHTGRTELGTLVGTPAHMSPEQARGEPATAHLATTAEKVYGPEHPELAKTLLNLGLAYASLDREAEARQLFERSLSIVEKALEPGHPQLVRAREILAEHCREGHSLPDDLCRKHGL